MNFEMEKYYTSDVSNDFSQFSTEVRFSHVFNSIELSNKAILDFGCGTGNLYGWLKSNNKPYGSYTGYDIRTRTLEFAKSKYANSNAEFTTSYPDKKYDIVVLFGTISYAFDSNVDTCKSFYKKELQRAISSLKDDGLLYVTLRKNGKEYSKDNKMMITYSLEDIKKLDISFQINNLFEHEYMLKYVKKVTYDK